MISNLSLKLSARLANISETNAAALLHARTRPLTCSQVALYSMATQGHADAIPENQEVPKPKTFASLLRNSVFMQMGEHKNVKLVGKIFQIQDENIYVDFGGKFHCVCDLDQLSLEDHEKKKYRRGKYVVISLMDFELSARFLGATRDTTLLEAKAKLVGLYFDQSRKLSAEKKSVDEVYAAHPQWEDSDFQAKENVFTAIQTPEDMGEMIADKAVEPSASSDEVTLTSNSHAQQDTHHKVVEVDEATTVENAGLDTSKKMLEQNEHGNTVLENPSEVSVNASDLSASKLNNEK